MFNALYVHTGVLSDCLSLENLKLNRTDKTQCILIRWDSEVAFSTTLKFCLRRGLPKNMCITK